MTNKIYQTINSDYALNYKQAFKLAKKYSNDDEIDGFSYEGDHGERCYVDFSDAFKTFLMNPVTEDIKTNQEWEIESKTWEGDIEKQLKSFIKVVRINNEWIKA